MMKDYGELKEIVAYYINKGYINIDDDEVDILYLHRPGDFSYNAESIVGIKRSNGKCVLARYMDEPGAKEEAKAAIRETFIKGLSAKVGV